MFSSSRRGDAAARLRPDRHPAEVERRCALRAARRRRDRVVRPRARAARLGATPCARDDYVAEAFKATTNFWRAWVGTRDLPRTLARDGAALRAHAEAADVPAARLDRRRADLRSAGADRRRAQLGLPLHVDSRRVVHALRPDAPRLHRRVGGVHAVGRGSAAPSSSPTARCRSCTASTAGTSSRRKSCPTSTATWTRARCASATARPQHLQLDIYGELLDAIYLYDKYGAPISFDLWVNVRRLIDWVCAQLARARTRASGRYAADGGSSSTRA